MNSFLTGSQVYGTPDELSDIDLVVLVSKEDKDFLFSKSNSSSKLMFGNLNIIALDKEYHNDVVKYEAWKKGTEHLKSIKPVTRDFAIEYFKSLGIEKKDYPEVNVADIHPEYILIDTNAEQNLSSNRISEDTPF
jgi:predicted nucleotidyltransferase